MPSPLAYCQRTDSIVAITSAFKVESYGYSQLAVRGGEDMPRNGLIGGAGSRMQEQGVNSKKVTPDWSLGIGEEAIHLQVINFKAC